MLPKTITFLDDPAVLLRDFLQDKRYSQVGVLVDEHTKVHCYPLISLSLPPHQVIQLKAGEEHKNLEGCQEVWHQLTNYSFDRQSLLIVLGGGVLGDLGGFCAATFKRGIDFVLVPTTLLAQADASIGGKLGIDFESFKNHIGVFQNPAGTLLSARFLKTLPFRELRSGYAEIVKHCLISDRQMWDKIRSKTLTDMPWEELIRHSVAFKHSIISEDPKEKGIRKILNFGHSIGHAIEGRFLSSGERVFHGEAVAMGMVAEAFIAHRKGMLNGEDLDQIATCLTGTFGPFRSINDYPDLVDRMRQDKKNIGKQILLALPEGIGKAVWDIPADEGEITASLEFLGSR